MKIEKRGALAAMAVAGFLCPVGVLANYVNFESSHVHPIALTPDGTTLMAVNTPDAQLEVFDVLPGGALQHREAIPVGLEPVTVVPRSNAEAWVVNNLSDTVSVVNLATGLVETTLDVGNEPTDVAFAGGKAFVAVSEEDAVRVFDLANLSAPPATVLLDGRDVRALDVSSDGSTVYAVVLKSGNGTSLIDAAVVTQNTPPSSPGSLSGLGLRSTACVGIPPGTAPAPRPPLPSGIVRNPALPTPVGGDPPTVALIVKWNAATLKWEDEEGTDWSHCLQYRPADDDLFAIDAATLSVTAIKSLGTILFDVAVHPSGKIYVPNTEARNFIPSTLHAMEGSGRFEHPSGVRGRPVDNRLTVVDPALAYSVNVIDLNAHIDRSTPTGPLAERQASVSQPGMLVWKADGSAGFMTAIGSHRVFRVDGTCSTPACILGATRATPDSVETGEGPTGVALLENAVGPGVDRLYVLNRISHSIALVDASGTSLTLVDEIALHDPSSLATKSGRRLLYDAVDASGHGDASCASCHISGDMDLLAWELGNPEDDFVPYSAAFDNVRFIASDGTPCTPGVDPDCSIATGFDPQKGPMTTQTLRGMLEPLHWRGDKPTMRDFNGAFAALLGAPGPLPTAEMNKFRDFSLEIATPPNPYRQVDDTIAVGDVQLNGMLFPGDPAVGETIFTTQATVNGGTCTVCHSSQFGTSGGVLGGLEPSEPTSLSAPAMLDGMVDQAVPNDLQIPHLRNVHEKFGAVWAPPGPLTCGTATAGLCDNDPSRTCLNDTDCSKPETKTMFGMAHDGAGSNLYRFLSSPVFVMSTEDRKDLVAFLYHFPSETRPSVGRQVTVDPGTPPTGTAAEEALLTQLLTLGDRADANRHCELVATTLIAGTSHGFYFEGGWVPDEALGATLTTTQLREAAEGPITFTCGTIESGVRLGVDRDLDGVLNADDCGPADAGSFASPTPIDDLLVEQAGPLMTDLSWTGQGGFAGTGTEYRVLTAPLLSLGSQGLSSVSCLAGGVASPMFTDTRPDPPPGDGFGYLLVVENGCGAAIDGEERESLLGLTCP